MLNPYEPTLGENHDRVSKTPLDRYRFAGLWLICSGLIQFVGMNAASAFADFRTTGDFSKFSFEWSPKLIVLLGVLVFYRSRLAAGLTRLTGTFSAIGFLFFLALLFFVESTPNSTLQYGRWTIEDPTNWQLALVLGSMAAVIIPPWLALELVVKEERLKWVGRLNLDENDET